MTLIARESGQEYYGDWVKVTLSSPRQTVLVFAGLDWHYGPNEGGDQDPGKMWHTGCGGEVHVIDGVHICNCGQDDHSRALVLAERIAVLGSESNREEKPMPEPIVEWRPFSYQDKGNTAPPAQELVWVIDHYQADDQYGGATLGVFDGFTMRLWSGTDDCMITHWAPLLPPEPPDNDQRESTKEE